MSTRGSSAMCVMYILTSHLSYRELHAIRSSYHALHSLLLGKTHLIHRNLTGWAIFPLLNTLLLANRLCKIMMFLLLCYTECFLCVIFVMKMSRFMNRMRTQGIAGRRCTFRLISFMWEIICEKIYYCMLGFWS